MPLQNKHSRTAGNAPNLTPGEMGVNLADGVLWMRSNGQNVGVSIAALRAYAPPAAGVDGAPLLQTAQGLQWAAQLAASSVAHAHIPIDAPPPANGWGVPGIYGAQAATCSIPANGVLIEPFYIASDALTTIALGFYVTDAAPVGQVRIGLLASNGFPIYDHVVTPVAGLNVVPASFELSPGPVYAMLWSSTARDLKGIAGFRPEQGWSYDVSDAPLFVAQETAIQNLSGGLFLPNVTTPVTSSTPGEQRFVLMRWQIGY